MDHIFIDLAIVRNEIVAIALVRTDGKSALLGSYHEEVRTKTGNQDLAALSAVWTYATYEILKPEYDSQYVVIAVNAETDRQQLKTALGKEPFGKHRWLDLLTLAWPMCYNEHISETSLGAICRHFEIPYQADGSILNDCEACVRAYFALMNKYKLALYGESIVKEVSGKGYGFLLRMFR